MNINRPYIEFRTSELIIFVEKEISTLKRYEIEHLINEILFRKKAKDKLKNCLDILKKKLKLLNGEQTNSLNQNQLSVHALNIEEFYSKKIDECRALSLSAGDTTTSDEFLKLQLKSELKNFEEINFVYFDNSGQNKKFKLNALGFPININELILVYNIFADQNFEKMSYLKTSEINQIKLFAEEFIYECGNKKLYELVDLSNEMYGVVAKIKDNFNSLSSIKIIVTSNKIISPKYKNINIQKIQNIYTSLQIIDINQFFSNTDTDTNKEMPSLLVNPKRISKAKKKQNKNPKWSRSEIIVALDFYFKHYPNIPGVNSQEIIEISNILRDMKLQKDNTITSNYRNTSGVYMKLMNFNHLNPDQSSKGLSGGSVLDQQIFKEFYNDQNFLSNIADEIKINSKNTDDIISTRNVLKPKLKNISKLDKKLKVLSKRNPKWSKEETIIALDFYFKNQPKFPEKNSPGIKAVSDTLRNMKLQKVKSINANYRNVTGVYMKLMNFQHLNFKHLHSGLHGGSILDRKLFKKYQYNQRDLSNIANDIIENSKCNDDGLDERKQQISISRKNVIQRFLTFWQN